MEEQRPIKILKSEEGYLLKDTKINQWLLGRIDNSSGWYQTSFTADEVGQKLFDEFGVEARNEVEKDTYKILEIESSK